MFKTQMANGKIQIPNPKIQNPKNKCSANLKWGAGGFYK